MFARFIFILSLISTCLGSLAQAQDLIYLRNSAVINARIMEISADMIKYRLYQKTESPTYSVETRLIRKIQYSTGEMMVFQDTPSDEQIATQAQSGRKKSLYIPQKEYTAKDSDAYNAAFALGAQEAESNYKAKWAEWLGFAGTLGYVVGGLLVIGGLYLVRIRPEKMKYLQGKPLDNEAFQYGFKKTAKLKLLRLAWKGFGKAMLVLVLLVLMLAGLRIGGAI